MHYPLKWFSLQKDASLIGVSSIKSRDGATATFLASPFFVVIGKPSVVLCGLDLYLLL